MIAGQDILSEPGTRGGAGACETRFLHGLFAVTEMEARESKASLPDLLGLEEVAIDDLIAAFPCDAASRLARRRRASGPTVEAEELALRGLLSLYLAEAGPLDWLMPAIFARRCQRPHHLWQDLGLDDRAQLRILIGRFFPRLAARNRQDMKWKKFFYRQLCASQDFGICSSPVCSDCDEYDDCFGPEDGHALLPPGERN